MLPNQGWWSDVADGTCSVDGCPKPVKCVGWCSAHYAYSLRHHGDPGPPGDRRKNKPKVKCSVMDCGMWAKCKGLCPMHYMRRKTKGSEHAKVRSWGGTRNITTGGYVRLWRPDHPEASSDGNVLEHRMVAHDTWGPIPPGHDIHHINHDRQDNRPENLEIKSRAQHASEHAREQGYIVNQFGTWPLRGRDPRSL